MEDKSKLQPYADLAVVTGKYTKDGKERNRYKNIGVLLATPHMSHMVIKLEALPLGGNGFISVFPREGILNDAKTEDPVNVNDIPF